MEDLRNTGDNFTNTKININLKENIKSQTNTLRLKICSPNYKTIMGSDGETYVILTTNNCEL